MLTKVEALSPWKEVPTLLLDENGRPETDLFHIRDIEGLDPVKAAINTAPLGSVDGTAFTGATVNNSRNIVLTIHPNPDWNEWTFETLRELLYVYFVPKQPTELFFHTESILPVKISGWTEDITLNPFIKDPEYQVSIICPDPYFTSVDPVVITGLTDQVGEGGATYPQVDYNGSAETGINVEVTTVEDIPDAQVDIQTSGGAGFGIHLRHCVMNSNQYVVGNSVPGAKYVQGIQISPPSIVSLMENLAYGSGWPVLEPGANDLMFSLIDSSTSDITPGQYKLSYYERHIGL